MSGFSIEQAARLNEGIQNSTYTKAEICRAVGIDQSVLTKITGPKALSRENVKRPMMHADTLAKICRLIHVSSDYILGYSDKLGEVQDKYRAEMPGLIDKMYAELWSAVRKKCLISDFRPTVDDVLHWWRDTGGVVGRGDDIEHYMDVVQMPTADTQMIRPVTMGPRSLASRKYNTTDPQYFTKQLESWPQHVHDVIVNGYRELANTGASFTGTAMDVVINNETVSYCSLRLASHIIGKRDPVAICFAVEWSPSSEYPGKNPSGSSITALA